MWANTPVGVRYARTWDAPGTHESIHTWYEPRLRAAGWRPWEAPSTVQWTFWKDKWLLTLARDGAWALNAVEAPAP
jgi:hypothetical protein